MCHLAIQMRVGELENDEKMALAGTVVEHCRQFLFYSPL